MESQEGHLTESGKRWEELHREFAAKADEQYYCEYPDQRPKTQKCLDVTEELEAEYAAKAHGMIQRTKEEIARDYYIASGRGNSAPTQATLDRIDRESLDKITDVVLAYHPKPKSKAAKKRVRKAKRDVRA